MLLREGVLFHAFADSIVAYHPDSGDTLAMETPCGQILVALRNSSGELALRQLLSCLGQHAVDSSESLDEATETYLATLELHDLIRIIDSA